MKRYFVITQKTEDNSHFNVQDLLPASCKLITGIAVSANVKQDGVLEDVSHDLSFPNALIKDLMQKEEILNLFYSYLRTRASVAESKDFFESDILPVITETISNNIVYSCLDGDSQTELKDKLIELYTVQFADYLYNDLDLYEKGKTMNNQAFADFIMQQSLVFAYLKKDEVFVRTEQEYVQPEPYECGTISLLVNGNSFLLRDYAVVANRKLKNMQKEVIPFHEPLDVNSNIHTVFKNAKNNDSRVLTIKTYIEYEHQ